MDEPIYQPKPLIIRKRKSRTENEIQALGGKGFDVQKTPEAEPIFIINQTLILFARRKRYKNLKTGIEGNFGTVAKIVERELA